MFTVEALNWTGVENRARSGPAALILGPGDPMDLRMIGDPRASSSRLPLDTESLKVECWWSWCLVFVCDVGVVGWLMENDRYQGRWRWRCYSPLPAPSGAAQQCVRLRHTSITNCDPGKHRSALTPLRAVSAEDPYKGHTFGAQAVGELASHSGDKTASTRT